MYFIGILLLFWGSAPLSWASTKDARLSFCVSTSAHQIEGKNTQSDWWQWERLPKKIKAGHTSDVAADSWNHVDEDIAAMKSMGVDTYRFSVEWAKIEPHEGQFQLAELDRYLEFIHRLKKENITPMVTLYHFTLPKWVADRGGWDWEGIDEAFDRYVQRVAEHFRHRSPRAVQMWNTLNEPMTLIAAGYISDVFPPGKKDMRSIALPMSQMIRAHARAYHTLHRILDQKNFKTQVAIAHHLRVFEPKRQYHPLDRYFTNKFDEIFNWAIPQALKTGEFEFKLPWIASVQEFIPEAKNTQDFFGLNYYSRDLISVHPFSQEKLQRHVKEGSAVNDLGWEIYPEGMGLLLDRVAALYPGMPIYITENGIADSSDQKRGPFIRSHLEQVSQARARGIPVRGYCHWTLMDNFEWAEGYNAPFGLYSLEPGTLKRVPKGSSLEYQRLIREFRP